MHPPTALAIATVCRSLALQSPEAWRVLQDRGYAVTFAAAEDTWTSALLERHPGSSFLPLHAERRLGPALLGLARQLRELSQQDWDVVQVQSPIIAALWRMVATRAARHRTIYVVHGFHFQPGERTLPSRAARLVESVLAHRTLALATVSAADARFVQNLPGWLRPRVVAALPGAGVPVEAVAPIAASSTGPPADAPTAPYALFIGDLNVNKDPMTAVATVAEYRRQGHPLDLVVIGEGPLEEELTRAAQAHPWLHHVVRTDEVPRWLAHAGMLLAPSHREGLPRVILEALAAGTPVVARHNRGSAELLAGGIGILVPGAEPEQWTAAVHRALTSPPAAAAMLTKARGYGTDRFRAAYEDLLTHVSPVGASPMSGVEHPPGPG